MLFVIPPDFEKAKKYAISKRVGKINMKDAELDPFSDLPANNDLYPLCVNTVELGELGSGYALLFGYLAFCMGLLLVLGAIVSGWNLYSNYTGDGCEARGSVNYPCYDNIYMKISWVNKKLDDDYMIFGILNIAFVVVGIIMLLFFRRWIILTARKIDAKITSVADFTVIVRGLPKTDTAEEIKAFLENSIPDVKVNKVCMAFKIGEYLDLVKQKQEAELLSAKRPDDKALKQLADELEIKIEELEQAIEKRDQSKLRFAKIAFVSFQTEKAAFEVRDKWDIGSLERIFYSMVSCFGCKPEKTYKGKIIAIDKAPEPDEIFWENLGYSFDELFWRRLLTNILSLLLIGGSFGAIIGLKQLEEETTFQYFSFISSFIVVIINNLLGIFTRKFVRSEKYETWTTFYTSVAKRLASAQFLNTSIVTWLVHYLIKKTLDHMWTQDSFIEDLYVLFILNAVVPQLILYMDTMYFVKKCRRWLAESKGKSSKLTQGQANKLFEGPSFDVARTYANVMKTMLFTAFYATLIPFSFVFSFAAILILFWTTKYLLLRRYSRPLPTNQDLCEEMVDYLELFFIVFGAGNLFFEYKIRGMISLYSYITIGLACFSYIIPWKPISHSFFSDKLTSSGLSYDEARLNFYNEYDRANPVYEEDAEREFEEYLEKLNKPDEKEANDDKRAIIEVPMMSQRNKKKQGLLKKIKQPQKNINADGTVKKNTLMNNGFSNKGLFQGNALKRQAIAQAKKRDAPVHITVNSKKVGPPPKEHDEHDEPIHKKVSKIIPLFSKDNVEGSSHQELKSKTPSLNKIPDISHDVKVISLNQGDGKAKDSPKLEEKLETEPLIDIKPQPVNKKTNKVGPTKLRPGGRNVEPEEVLTPSQIKTKYY